jgi:hypothetical protein
LATGADPADSAKTAPVAPRPSKTCVINDSLSFVFETPRIGTFVPNVFRDLWLVPQELVKKENLLPLAGVAVSTAILIYYDQDLVDAAQRFGRYIGLGTDNHVYNIVHSKIVPIYVPETLPAALYYLGDGLTELGVNAGFYVYGKAKNDPRALRTASELSEGLSTAGIITQILKHVTGRQTPMRATQARGVWQFFPPISHYQSSVPTHDAFPSGHLASAMVTTAIISMNYPEYKFVKPLCYSLMTVCGYQMMNNGVHWISDYPLALAIGYAIGKIAVERGRKIEMSGKESSAAQDPRSFRPRFALVPAFRESGTAGVVLTMRF